MTGHIDTYAERGTRDPRPFCKATPADMADAWNRDALNEAEFGSQERAEKSRLFAQVAVLK